MKRISQPYFKDTLKFQIKVPVFWMKTDAVRHKYRDIVEGNAKNLSFCTM